MSFAAQIAIIAVAVIHVLIAGVEMLGWTTLGPRVFKSLDPDLFEPTKAIAANQGLYNFFLAAGLFWALRIVDPKWAVNIAFFFLACVIVAGVFGALTVSKTILLVQTGPALIAAFLVYRALPEPV